MIKRTVLSRLFPKQTRHNQYTTVIYRMLDRVLHDENVERPENRTNAIARICERYYKMH